MSSKTAPLNKSLASLKAETSEPILKPLYHYQDQLPKLPVPKLSQTLPKYLQTVKPVVNSETYTTTEKIVQEFANSEQAKTLQSRLETRAADPTVKNWLSAWWDDLAYFSYREPVVINVSYFYSYLPPTQPTKNTRRAAEILQAINSFKKSVVEETLEPESNRKGFMCMNSFKYMFNATRLPIKDTDTMGLYDPIANDYVVVIRKNQFFKLNLKHEGKPLSTSQLEQQLDWIVQQAGNSSQLGIGVFTTENRDKWAEIKPKIKAVSQINAQSLDQIDAGAYVLALDDTKPITREEVNRGNWHGDGVNRYFDKSLQFIVYENGQAGFNGEHTLMDGTPTFRLNHFVCSALYENKVDHGTDASTANLPKPQPLPVTLNAELQKQAEISKQSFNAVIDKHQLKVLHYTKYGKTAIKQFKQSPDAFTQLIIQLAFFNLHKCVKPTYESAATRKFQLGRTETCRSVSVASKTFVENANNPKLSEAQKLHLAKEAVKAQVGYMADAVQGLGVDRHLLGLKLSLQKGEPIPKLFQDPSFSLSNHWNLSTSQISSNHFYGYGWGEVVEDGYGIAYQVNDNALMFNVVARDPKSQTNVKEIVPDVTKMVAELDSAADTLWKLFSLDNAKL